MVAFTKQKYIFTVLNHSIKAKENMGSFNINSFNNEIFAGRNITSIIKCIKKKR